MIYLRTKREINLIKSASKIIIKIFKEVKKMCIPNITTLEIDNKINDILKKNNVISAFKNYNGFPCNACISVNDTLVHGIPDSKIVLKDGDIVSIDVGVVFNGYYADACRTFAVGKINQNAKNIIDVVKKCFFKAALLIKPGIHLGDISHEIEKCARDNGYSIPREFAGHGIGNHLHEDPVILNYGEKEKGIVLYEGMCLAIEPMIAEGKNSVKILEDGWTTKMRDGKLSAHYENTLVVTKDGCEILTLGDE